MVRVGARGEDGTAKPLKANNNGELILDSRIVSGGITYIPFPANPVDTQISLVGETALYGGRIYSVLQDTNNLYMAGATDRTLQKFNKSTLDFIAKSDHRYSDVIRVMWQDTDYIYLGGDGDYTVRKIAKSDLALVATSISYGASVRAIVGDDNFIYVAGSTTQKVWKLNKSDLSRVESSPGVYIESPAYGYNIYSLYYDGVNIYMGGATGSKVWKLNPLDLSKIGESSVISSIIYNIVGIDDYIYIAVGGSHKAYKLSKTDLAINAESAAQTGIVQNIFTNNKYIYLVGEEGIIQKLDKDTLTAIAESPGYGSIIYTGAADESHIYVGGGDSATIAKVKKYAQVTYKDIYWKPVT